MRCCAGMRVLLFALLGLACLAAAADRPNIVVILSDDYGWGSVGCYGANPELVKTPNLDRLAREGRRFTDANTTSSVCSPTRYALMTGRYCWRTSLISEVLSTVAPLHIETTRLTMASMLKSQGYQCAAVGKWHLGYGTAERCDYTKELKPGPLEIGFDDHFGVPSNHGDMAGVYVENHWVAGLNRQSPSQPSPPYVTMGQQKGKPAKTLDLNAPKRVDEDVMATLTDRIVNWIGQQSAQKPFFVYFTPVAVHNPITPSKATAGKSKGGPFCDFIADLDLSVGRVLEVLDQKGFAKDTLVIFTSDNGPHQESGHDPKRFNPSGPWRGMKRSLTDGGIRVPFIAWWPGQIKPGLSAHVGHFSDLLPTAAELAGAQPPALTDGISLLPSLQGRSAEQANHEFLYWEFHEGGFRQATLYQGRWKGIRSAPKAEALELYDLQNDPTEQRNLAALQPELVARLSAYLDQARSDNPDWRPQWTQAKAGRRNKAGKPKP